MTAHRFAFFRCIITFPCNAGPEPQREILCVRATPDGTALSRIGKAMQCSMQYDNLLQEEPIMNVILDLCVVPVGVGVSVSRYVAACQPILEQAGLQPHLHAYGTTVEGEWDTVFAAVKACHEKLHEMGVPRLSTTIKLGTRTDRSQTIDAKVRSVEEKLRPASGR